MFSFAIRKRKNIMNATDSDKKNLEAAATYYDDLIVFIDNVQTLKTASTGKPNGYAAILCTKGQADVNIDNKPHQVKAGDLFICQPNLFIEKFTMDSDFQCRVIGMSLQYVKQINIVSGNIWDIKLFFDQTPIIHLQPEEVTIFCQYYDLLVSKLTGQHIKYHKELMETLLKAFSYELRSVLERVISVKPPTYTSGQHIFKEFLELLSTSTPRPRTVSYYSDRLCITPKYLSAVCKEASGKTASELINQYVVKDIVYLLHRPDKSIKDIAFELDFPNLSFFGKYVKKHLGMSPKMYRQKKDKLGIDD